MTDSYLQQLVITRCKELGAPENPAKAAEFFEVAPGLVRQWVNGSKTPSLAAVEKVFVMPPEKAADASWTAKEVFVAMPVYRYSNPRTMLSLLGVWDRSKFGFNYHWGDAFIVHTRNKLADDFKRSGMPWCWWVDDDVIAPFGHAGLFNAATKMNLAPEFAGVHAPSKLRSRNLSLVGGLYFGRNENGRALYAEALMDNTENAFAHRAPVDLVKPTEFVATGCLMHTRQVLDDIEKKFPHLAPPSPNDVWQYFSNLSDGVVLFFNDLAGMLDQVSAELGRGSAEGAGHLLGEIKRRAHSAAEENARLAVSGQGEDATFCKRAKVAGHQPHVDFSVVCGHADGSVVWGPHNTKY